MTQDATAPAELPGIQDKDRVAAGIYTADAEHTMVVWEVNHLGFSKLSGIFQNVTGNLEIDPNRLENAKVDITIPVSKILTISSALNFHLFKDGDEGGKPDFFGSDPEDAKFKSTTTEIVGDTRAKVTGDLTLNGATNSVVLDVTFFGAGVNPMNGQSTIGFEATATISRSDFGLGYAAPMVSDKTKLRIHAAFEK